MRRVLWVAGVAVLAASAAGAAVAHDHPGGRFGGIGNPGITDVSASTALAIGNVTSASCSGADGTYKTDRFNATGAIAGGQLAGNATLALKWVMNTSKNDGYAVGRLVVRNSDGSLRALAKVVGVVEGNKLSGFLEGRFANSTTRGALIGTLEATRNGSLAIKIGTNNAAGAAVVFGGTGCPRT
jgi:hypothetical protein